MVSESEQFCSKCTKSVLHSHIVQCQNCQSIVNILPPYSNEEPIIFYVDKCSLCSGTKKDEQILTPHYFPESFI